MNKRFVYLDHSASTAVDERVLEAMMPYFSEVYGNPASIHSFARASEKGVEAARQTIADILNCQPHEVVFTSCGSESDNLALRGSALLAQQAGKPAHLITSQVEHSAVGRTAAQLQTFMHCDVSYVPLERDGMVTAEGLESVIRDDTTLVSLMYANNEIGTVLPIADLAEIAHHHGAWFHTDAVQAGGQMPLDVKALNVDMLSLSAHKFYGPKGVGVLYVRDGINLIPSQTGGSHEEGRRAGTLNVPLIVGMGKALEIAYAEREERTARMRQLRDQLIEGVLQRVPDSELTGSRESRLPSHASFVFKHVDGNQLLMFLDNKGIGASSGSACKVGNPKPSALLMTLGYDESWALGGLRLTLGRHTSADDIEYTLEVLLQEIEKVRLFSGIMAS